MSRACDNRIQRLNGGWNRTRVGRAMTSSPLAMARSRATLFRPSRRLLIAGLLILGAFRVVVFVVAMQGHLQDIDRFFTLGHASGRPYADYAVEYPPVLLALLKLVAVVTPSEHAFSAMIVVISLLAEAAVAAMLWRRWSSETAFWYLAVDTLLLGLFAVRLDLVCVALVVAATVAALRSKPTLAALCIVAAIGFKLWPAPIALILLPLVQPGQRRRYVASGLAALAVLLIAWLSLGGIAAIQQVVTFRGATGWQVESVGGSIVRLFTGEPVVGQTGAERFGHVPAALPLLMQCGAAALAAWAAMRTRAAQDIGSAWVVSVGGFLTASTLFSPQFTAWLIPAGAIAWWSRDRLVAAGVAALAITTVLENSAYPQVVALSAEGSALLLLRNLVLLLTVLAAVQTLRRRSRAAVAPRRLAQV